MTCLHLPNTLQEPGIVDYLIQKGAKFDVPTKVNWSGEVHVSMKMSEIDYVHVHCIRCVCVYICTCTYKYLNIVLHTVACAVHVQ